MNAFDFSWMIGRTLSVEFSEPNNWWFSFEDSVGISVECPWRIIEDGSISVSGDDHRQQFGLPAPIDAAAFATQRLAGTPITRVEVRSGTADLVLNLEGGLRLEILPFSSGYESWQVVRPDGKHVVAQGGGQLSSW
jgi:hypothetical protein